MDPEQKEQDYHPDPKSADKIHDSGAEVNNIMTDAISDEAKSAAKSSSVNPTEHPVGTSLFAEGEGPTPAAPVKKKHGKLVALIIAAVILLCGIGAFVWFMIWRSQPEVVAMDAMVNYFDMRTMQLSGSINVELDNPNFPGKATLAFSSKVNGLNNDMTAALNLVSEEYDANITIELKEIFTENGELYFQISKLQETFDAIEQAFGKDAVAGIMLFSDTVELADGTWFRVFIPELLDDFSDQIPASDRHKYKKAYSCTIDALKKAATEGTELADIYREHPFLTITDYKGKDFASKQGGNLYELDLKVGELQDFLRADFTELTVYQEVKNCFEELDLDFNITPAIDGAENQLEDINTAITNDNHLVLEIDGWSHRILGVQTRGKNDAGLSFSAELEYTYPNDITINTPTDYKPVSKLVETAITDFSNMLYTSIDDYSFQLD